MSQSHKVFGKTILVVDDTDEVRKMVVTILEGANYRVLSANSGRKAITVSEETEGKIDLLLTDWDMPEMSGVALGEALEITRPDIHVMQMSGGAHDSMMIMNYRWAFLQKPFVRSKLIAMVNDVLHSPDRAQLGGASFDSRLDTNPTAPQAKDPDIHPAESTEPKDRGK